MSTKTCYGQAADVLDRLACCLEVETGARNIDQIMNGSILPLLSQEILQRMSEGDLPPTLTLDVNEDAEFEVT